MTSTETKMVKELKKQAQREEWQKQYEEQQASGLRATEWCRQKGILPSTYFKRIEKLRYEYCEKLVSSNGVQESNHQNQEIVPVAVYQQEICSPSPIVIKAGEISIELSAESSAEVITRVIKALKTC